MVHVKAEMQWSTGVHCGQVSAEPSARYWPLWQRVHCESLALVQVTGLTQPGTGVQRGHVVPEPALLT